MKRIKEFRLSHHLTLAELSKKVCLSITALSMMENGHRNPSIKVAFKMADFYGVSVEKLFPELKEEVKV